jgi:putative DNA primase/helicase
MNSEYNSTEMTAKGLMENNNLICSPFKILGKAKKSDSTGWGQVIELKDEDQQMHQILINNTELTDSKLLIDKLTDCGLIIYNLSKKNAIANYISSSKSEDRFLVSESIGWNGNSYFLPASNTLFSKANIKTIHKGSSNSFAKDCVKGSLSSWNEKLGYLMSGNSNLILGFTTVLAAPLLRFLNRQNYGFNFVGKSSIGKTTCLEFAASIVGSTEKNNNYITNFRATDNGLEAYCFGHNDLCLILDEFGQAEKIAETIYLLGNGNTKGRGTKDGGTSKRKAFNITYLISSELSLKNALYSSGQSIKSGMEVRFIDVDAEIEDLRSCYENLHGFDSGKMLSDYIKAETKNNYGGLFPEYIKNIVNEINFDHDQFVLKIRGWADDFLKSESDKADNEIILRILSCLALSYAAGMFSIEKNLISLTQSELIIGLSRFVTMIRQKHAGAQNETKHIAELVQSFILQHEKSRFDYNNTLGEKIINRAGIIKEIGGSKKYCIFNNVMKGEICKGYSPQQISSALFSFDLITKDSEGKLAHNTYLSNGDKSARSYHIDSKILNMDFS